MTLEKENHILSCRDLDFSWQKEALLRKIDFTVNRGEFVVVIGGNGTGKSTLMRLLMGEIFADRGEIRLFDSPIREFSEWTRLAYLPQNATSRNEDFPATAEELVRSYLTARRKQNGLSRQGVRTAAREALALVGLKEQATQLLSELSGGQQQRVLLASVIAAKPELMLLDEPTSGIDYENSQILYHLLRHMKEQLDMTILIITHDTDRIAAFADRVFCLEGGTLLELSRTELESEMKHRHKHPLPESGELDFSCCWEGCEEKGELS